MKSNREKGPNDVRSLLILAENESEDLLSLDAAQKHYIERVMRMIGGQDGGFVGRSPALGPEINHSIPHEAARH